MAWNNRKDLAEQRFATAEAQFDALVERKPELLTMLAQARTEYANLYDAAREKYERIARLRSANADWEYIEPVNDELFALREEGAALRADVDALQQQIRSALRSIRDGYDEAASFCDPSDRQAMRLDFCPQISEQRAELENVIEELRAEYEAWEELKQ